MNAKLAILSLLTILSTAAHASEEALECGNKFEKTTLVYDIEGGSARLVGETFTRGPLYTSESDKSVKNNENVIYVRGSTSETIVTELGDVSVAKITGGVELTLKNPGRSKISFVKKNNQLVIGSANEALLEAVSGGNTEIDCGE